MSEHWSRSLLGLPWQAGARGPCAFDCWGLLRHVYDIQLAIKLPLVNGFDAADIISCKEAIEGELPKWKPLAFPVDMCAVGMSMSTRFLHHVGIYLALDGGVILHCHERSGVLIQSARELKQKGWRRIDYYDYNR